MTKEFSGKQLVFISLMLFSMFFGAGNLIFPVFLGQAAGDNMWPSLAGFICFCSRTADPGGCGYCESRELSDTEFPSTPVICPYFSIYHLYFNRPRPCHP